MHNLIRQTGSIEACFENKSKYPIQKHIFAVKKWIQKVQVTELLKGVISLWGQKCYQTVVLCDTN